VATAGDTVAAVCEAMWSADSPAHATQTFTGVAREFRGKGLALAVKTRMLDLIVRALPQVTHVDTHNAETNVPMLRVNAALGFKAWRHMGICQVERDALASALATHERPR